MGGAHRLGSLAPARTEAALAIIAAAHKTTISKCELPLDGSRFEGLIPPVVWRLCSPSGARPRRRSPASRAKWRDQAEL